VCSPRPPVPARRISKTASLPDPPSSTLPCRPGSRRHDPPGQASRRVVALRDVDSDQPPVSVVEATWRDVSACAAAKRRPDCLVTRGVRRGNSHPAGALDQQGPCNVLHRSRACVIPIKYHYGDRQSASLAQGWFVWREMAS
jgi:hypothetical protein